ncbi:MAG: tRNA epoxyqueuosine(34) reductase QueG, partial [Chloroflexota bacterium]|nr:tRNA epoxyqueuosine(34) reductase QueG [Chloroflexota bacterium]
APPPGMALSESVKQRARSLGFSPVGITTADPFPEDEARMLAWLAAGHQAGLGWMTPERQRRACRPEELLPGTRTLIVVAAAYADAQPASRPADGAPRGRVARYARGVDYHDVMKARLRELAAYLESLAGPDGPPVRTRMFVDASPLVERAAAVRAGLGFIGKNTNLLTADAGSWLLLGAILTDLALDADRPVLRDCGQCRLCLDACPTGALPAPYVLDANRCISYLTIEHRGPIPDDLRPLIGDHVFGCDICQEVCPWNRRTRVLPWPEFAGEPDAGAPALADLLALDADGFRRRYRSTPVARTKRRGLLRNAAVALGNVGGPADVPALGAALADDEPLVRAHAAWALGRIGSAEARRLLGEALESEGDDEVRAEIRAALDASSGRPAGRATEDG